MAADPGNTGDHRFKRETVILCDDMAAYDALPAEHRRRLQQMSDPWGAAGVRKLIDAHGPAYTLAIMDKIEADVQTAYQKRLSACPVR